MIIDGKIVVIDRLVIKILEKKQYYNKLGIGVNVLKGTAKNLEAFFDAGFKNYVVDNDDKFVWTFIHNIIKRHVVEFEDKKTFQFCYGAFDLNENKLTDLSELESVTNEDIETIFQNSEIGRFNEFQYFIGLTELQDNCFEGSTVTNIILPETILTIGDRVFANTKELDIIYMPEHIESLGDYIFAGSNVKSIIFDGTTCPEITENTFEGIPDDCKIYVSGDLMRKFRSHDENWNKLKERLYPLDFDAEFWDGMDDYLVDMDCPECDCEALTEEELKEICR